MSAHHDLAALADLCGILPSYHDLQGGERITSPETQKALLAANGIDVVNEASIHETLAAMRGAIEDRWFPEEVIIESGVTAPLDFGLGATWQLRLDGQETITAEGHPCNFITLPPLPSGIYALTAQASGRTEFVTVLAAPKRLPSTETVTGKGRIWGLNLALYGLQSKRNSGLGDFEDLAQIAGIAGEHGAAFLGINPLHNMGFSDVDAISPYSPSHRGYVNTSYIALDAIPGLDSAQDAAAFAGIKEAETVQYADHKRAHNQMLEALYVTFKSDAAPAAKAAFANFKQSSGSEMQDFATFETLSETHGTDWRTWPNDTGSMPNERIEFHIWHQWVANTQLGTAQDRAKAAGMPLGLYLDLAVGPRRDGAESWCERDAIAKGVSIGAPPDHLSPEGQNWDLAAFSPRKLSALRYAPLRRILAQTMRHAGIIRIDHVLGLSRSFWIADDGSPGGYIRQPFESLLAIIKIEAERHNCVVIGEDLGLVPNGFRDTMRDHGFYGYSVLQYEKDNQDTFRDPGRGLAQVLSCFATHDTPTIKGFETGRDIDWWHRLGWIDDDASDALHDQRAADVSAMSRDADLRANVHDTLARSNAGLVAVQLDDVVGAVEAQNLPGTIDEHPNWRRKYDTSLEDLSNDDRLGTVASMMHDAGRANNNEGTSDEG
jgi:4-alpha-glucanotransferase